MVRDGGQQQRRFGVRQVLLADGPPSLGVAKSHCPTAPRCRMWARNPRRNAANCSGSHGNTASHCGRVQPVLFRLGSFLARFVLKMHLHRRTPAYAGPARAHS